MADIEQTLWERGDANYMQSIYQLEEGPPPSLNATHSLIKTLIFSEIKSIRTSTIILGSFNILAAFLMASSILYDCYSASKKANGGSNARKFYLPAIHPAETFPLVLSLGIVVQGLIFVGVQSAGMSSLFIEGCTVISQFVFPAIFIVPYIQIVFGLECTIRSLRNGGFQTRGRYNIPICLACIIVMLLITSIPSHDSPETNFCFATLVWFVGNYGQVGFGLLAMCGVLAIISAAIIFYRLTTLTNIDHQQRIAASRMVYYLVLAVLALAFVIPWFVALTLENPNPLTLMMATIVLNLHGLMAGLLQMFLRSNTATTALRPKNTPGWISERHEIRLWGPNDLGIDGHLLNSVSGSRSPGSIGSRSSLIENEKGRKGSLDSIRGPGETELSGETSKSFGKVVEEPTNMSMLVRPEAVVLQRTPTNSHRRKQSYGLFPQHPNDPTLVQRQELDRNGRVPKPGIKDMITEIAQPSSVQQHVGEHTFDASDILKPPPSLFGANSSRHRRDSSIQTSVTVEIGLRLSHAPTELQYPSPPRSRRASPILRLQTNLSPIISRSPLAPSPLKTTTVRSPLTAEQRAARMKTLPPIPRHSTMSDISGAVESMIKLSPTVYTPQGIKRSATTGMTPPPRPTDLSPLWPRKMDDSSRPRGSKASWI